MDATTVAVDLAKDVFEVATANRVGRILERKRLTRRQFEAFVDALPAGTRVVMEACGTAHYWGRRCQAHGHDVQLLPVQYVKPYVRRNKTDRMDTEALLEAARCAGIHPVPLKTPEQQALQALHRVRTQWQRTRTARINTLRGMLREHGIPIALGARTVLTKMPRILEDADNGLPAQLCLALALVSNEVRALERDLRDIDRQLARVAAADPVAQRLLTIPGIGVITATALLGTVAHIHAFRRARHFASWLGLTPSERSSGFRRHLGRISKRGDVYLRGLLTHGARAVLLTAQRTLRGKGQGTRFQHWAVAVAARRGHNKAAIAVANKLARVVWAVWRGERDFSDGPQMPVAA
ncbi:MAG: IS110 family transposase [Acidobacteriota bacterium]